MIGENYQSHYNTKIKKCLIYITESFSMKGQITESDDLLDAFERREYADYLQIIKNNAKYDVPAYCVLSPNFDQAKHCSSKAEFDAFVAKYMEQ